MESRGSFGPREMKVIIVAYSMAIAALGGGISPGFRETIASYIIRCASHGELDPQKLCDCAVRAIGPFVWWTTSHEKSE
jgi:hypothetical protein